MLSVLNVSIIINLLKIIYYCKLFDKKKMDYIIGEEIIIKRKECKKINKKGNCQLYVEKEDNDGENRS